MGSRSRDIPFTLKYGQVLVFTFLSCLSGSIMAQLPPAPRRFWGLPTACVSGHDVGKLFLGVSNKGYFGNSTIAPYYSCINGTNNPIGSEYPIGSGIRMMHYGSIWIGGIRDGDTLVTEGFFGGFWEVPFHLHPPLSEMNPEEFPFGEIIEQSTLSDSRSFKINAISHQDLIAVYMDTIVTLENIYDGHPGYRDFLDYRLHQPLFIRRSEE